VKVLNVFGLQPKIRSDLQDWSPDLFATFSYLSNRSDEQHKRTAIKTLDLLFDKTEHNSYFNKLNFGIKEKFKTLSNSSLYLLILTWLRQLEQYFYNFESNGDSLGDWNKHGKYYGTSTLLKAAPLAIIHMAKAIEKRTHVTDVAFFEPDDRDGVCVSLEEWGARIFTPYNKKVLRDAKIGCEKTKIRFERAKKVEVFFSFTSTDLSNKVSNNNNDGVQESAAVAMAYGISPDQHQGQKKEMLLYNISSGIQLLLNKCEENINKKRKKIKEEEEDDTAIATTAASSLLALVNGMDKSNKFNKLNKMQNHMSYLIAKQNGEKTNDYVEIGKNNKKDSEKNKQNSGDSDYEPSSSSSEDERKTPLKGLKKQKLCNMSSRDSDDE
jgi:hypothetical protein